MKKIERITEARSHFGVGRSTFYNLCKQGMITRAVRISPRSVGWPSDELGAIVSARIAGRSDDEIRDLVKSLHALRAKADT